MLVIGSPPPHGHDLDLLVPPAQERTIESILAGAGFTRHTVPPFRGYPKGFARWALFRDCDADVVDTVPLGNFELPREEARRLLAEARPIQGFARLLRPAPHHVLLRLAHDFLDPATGHAPLSASRRRRVEHALAEDPLARERARELAPAWRRPERLARLEAAFALGETVPADDRRSRLAGSRAVTLLRALRAYRRAWRRGHVVALCGPDDERRKVQAEGLARALRALDIPARVERVVLRSDAPAADARRGICRERRAPGGPWLYAARAPVAHLLAARTALRYSAVQRGAVLAGLQAGEVVICDGYTLDAAVELRARYGARRIGFHTAVMHALSPRPRRAYLIAGREPGVAPYVERQAALGLRVVDGARAPEDLCAEIALDVWRAVR